MPRSLQGFLCSRRLLIGKVGDVGSPQPAQFRACRAILLHHIQGVFKFLRNLIGNGGKLHGGSVSSP